MTSPSDAGDPMALLHAATISPSKLELVGRYLATRGRAGVGDLELIGAHRFDDADGEVGLETHLVRSDGVVVQVPTTYRDRPLDGADEALIGTMEHSVLGTRWVYDGLADPAYVAMLAAVTLTGTGQSVGVLRREGRSIVRPPSVRLSWSGPTVEAVAVDGFAPPAPHGTTSVLANGDVELTFVHQPAAVDAASSGDFRLLGSWAGLDAPVVLAGARLLRGDAGAAS